MKKTLLLMMFFLFLSFITRAESVYRKPLPTLDTSFDPIIFTHASNIAIINQIYDRLFDLNEFNEVKPKLTSTWETNNDASLYKICVKDGVVFHNGKILSSDDVIFSLQRLISNKSVFKKEFSIIKGASDFQKDNTKSVAGLKKISATCLSVELERPFPLFITMLAASKTEIIPSEFLGRSETDFFKQPIGTGPFKFYKYEPNKFIELVANDKYFLGPPKLQRIIYTKENRSEAISNFNKRNYQDLEWFYPQPTELSINYSVMKIPIAATNIFAFNLRNPSLKNIHFRRAVSYAINKQSLIGACFPGNIIARGYIPPGLAGYNKNLLDYDYNLQMAKDELKKSNLTKKSLEQPITILRPDNYPCSDLFKKLVESDLKAVGINATVVYLPYSDLMEKHFKPRDFEMINLLFAADFPEASFMLSDFRSDSQMNFTGISSSDIDNFLNIIDTTTDRYIRYKTYEDIQRILYENAVTINLCYHIASIVYQPNVRGHSPSTLGTLYYSSMWPVYLEEDEK